MEKENKKCPKCNNNLTPINARCICSKDFCMGQRCGANETIDHYKCLKCEYVSEQTPEGKNYFDKYINK
jgi:hypothetical protein